MADHEERYAESKGHKYVLSTLPHFCIFRALALSTEPGWTVHYSDAVLKVESKPPNDASTTLNIIRATRIMETVPPLVLYNQLHDAQYRVTWDTAMVEGYNIVKLDAHNDIGYYAAQFPWPLSNRDFCNQRSWMEFTNGEYIIFNHSEPHPDCPEKQGFVRARSILSGYYIRPNKAGSGTELVYVTHSDPGGSIPHSIINFFMTKGAPKLLGKCEKYSEQYPEYAAKMYPPDYVYPWRTPKMDWDSPYLYPEDIPVGSKQVAQEAAAGEKPSASAAQDTGSADGEAAGAGAASKTAAGPTAPVSPFLSRTPAPTGAPTLALAPVAPYQLSDLLSVQQYRSIMQDSMNAVDRSFLREGRVPTTKEYILRLKYMLEGIRQTSVDV